MNQVLPKCDYPRLSRHGDTQIAERLTDAHPGFTLIELLVVVAIISILAAMVMAAVSRGMRSAKSITCNNNLKQWGLVWQMFADENDGWIPRETFQADGKVGQETWADVGSETNIDTWYNALPAILKRPSAGSYLPAPEKFSEDRLFHCPAANFPGEMSLKECAYFSLAMNSKLIREPTFPPAYSIQISSIQDPVNTVAFLDERVNPLEPKVADQTDKSLGQPSAYASRFAARHGAKGNLAFADGHVAGWRGDKVVETRPEFPNNGKAIFPFGNVFWCADPLEDPNN